MVENLRDPATGLWNDDFFHASLQTRLAAARRELRPLCVVLLALGRPDGDLDRSDESARELAYALLRTLRDCDQASRLHDGSFGVLLEAADARGGAACVDRLHPFLTSHHVVWAGVADYPTHGLEAAELAENTQAALQDARRWTTSRTEVAILG